MNWATASPLTRLKPHLWLNLLRQAIADRPDSPELLLEFGRALLSQNHFAEAAGAFRAASALNVCGPAFDWLGTALLAINDNHAAAEAYTRALEHTPDSSTARLGLARAQQRLGDVGGALRTALIACARPPLSSRLFDFVAPALIADGRAGELLTLTDATLAAVPMHTAAWFHRARALVALGRPMDAIAIMRASLVRVVDVAPPAGVPAFNDALREEILANGSLVFAPLGHAVRKSYRARVLLAGNPPALTALMEIARAEFDVYAGLHRGSSGIGTVATPPASVWLDSWATVFGSDGHEVQHIHPSGWISGVYYVSAPKAALTPDLPGKLLVPATPQSEGENADGWPELAIAPQPGRMVIFPSYFPHATVPSGSDELRISVAFDVVPTSNAKGELGMSG